MNQYSRRAGGGRGDGYDQNQAETRPSPLQKFNDRPGLDLNERLPLGPPSNPKFPPMINQLASSASNSPREQEERSKGISGNDRSGRSLTNPPMGRSVSGPREPSTRPNPTQIPDNRTPIVRPQPRYNRPYDYEEVIDSPSLMVSPTIGTSAMNSPRSIFIGFDDPPVIANTYPPQAQQRRITNTVPPPSSRRGVPSYYSQPAIGVSPIPEESPNPRHGSYASSHVIPSAWGNVEYAGPSEYENQDDNPYRPMPNEDDDQKGLVRQASLGKKSKPTLTDIRSPSRQDSTKKISQKTDYDSPAKPSPSPLPSPLAIQAPVTVSPNSVRVPSPLMAFKFPSPSSTMDFEAVRKEAEILNLVAEPGTHSRNSSVFTPIEPLSPNRAGNFSTSGRMKGRKVPPGLNLGAVREAEARGSLTSLPDLIRRATKLAAALENGKHHGTWSSRGSFSASHLTNSSSNRRTDSISDILASFPTAVPRGASRGRQGSRALSAWPLPGDYMDKNMEHSSLESQPNKGRKVCGLPLWAFVFLVILALLVIAAAVIVPLQLVTLSRNQENETDSTAEALRQCRNTNLCLNGGEVVATTDFCGCICTGGFSGKTCAERDKSCVTMDLEQIKRSGITFEGIQNATMGSAIKRLLELSDEKYNVELDANKMLSAFSADDLSCTAQNALVTFNGKSAPDGDAGPPLASSTPIPDSSNQKLEDLVYDTSLMPSVTDVVTSSNTPTPDPSPTDSSPTGTVTPAPVLDEDAVDFSRVAVLFLVQDKGLSAAVQAQEKLQHTFTMGVGYGTVDVGNQAFVDLDNRVLRLPGGISVGGAKKDATASTISQT